MRKYKAFILMSLATALVMAGGPTRVNVERAAADESLGANGETVGAETQGEPVFYLDSAELENGYVYLVKEDDLDPAGDYVTVTLPELQTLVSGSIVAYGLYYHSSHGWIIRMVNCNPNCSQTITIQNTSGYSSPIYVAKDGGSYSISGGTVGSTFYLSSGSSVSYTLSSTMPSSPFGYQAQQWDGALIIDGLTTSGTSYLNVCMSQDTSYCN